MEQTLAQVLVVKIHLMVVLRCEAPHYQESNRVSYSCLGRVWNEKKMLLKVPLAVRCLGLSLRVEDNPQLGVCLH